MPVPSSDLYSQILRALAYGQTVREIAERFVVRTEWVETIAATDGARANLARIPGKPE